MGFRDVTLPHDWVRSFERLNRICKPKILQNLSFLLLSIWKARNTVIFKNKILKPIACIISAKKMSAERRIRNCLSVEHYFRGCPSTPPPKKTCLITTPYTWKCEINFDSSLQNNSTTRGYILRD